MLKLYPEFQERFAEEVCHDLTYNLREGYDADVSFILDFYLHEKGSLYSKMLDKKVFTYSVLKFYPEFWERFAKEITRDLFVKVMTMI